MAARAREISGNRPATKSDAYTGLLIVSLLAQVIGATFFYLDWNSYPTAKPTVPAAPQISAPQGGGGGQPAGNPGVPGGGNPGVPGGGNPGAPKT